MSSESGNHLFQRWTCTNVATVFKKKGYEWSDGKRESTCILQQEKSLHLLSQEVQQSSSYWKPPYLSMLYHIGILPLFITCKCFFVPLQTCSCQHSQRYLWGNDLSEKEMLQAIKSPQCAKTSVEADCQGYIIKYGPYVLLAYIVLNKEMCHQIILKRSANALCWGRIIMILHWNGTPTCAFLKSAKAKKTNKDIKRGLFLECG